jgi:drug/metabolite transporter (DMT)-like permease
VKARVGWLALGAVAVSTSAPLVRGAHAPALAVAAWRNLLSAAVLMPIALVWHGGELRAMDTRTRRRCAVSGVLLAVHFAAWVPSLSFTTVASSVALVTTQPVWTALFARLRGDHVPTSAWTGIAITMAGVVVLTGLDVSVSTRALVGDGLALLGGLLAAAYFLVGAEVRRTVSTTSYTAICYAVAGVLLAGATLLAGQPITGFSANSWLCIGAITVGPQLLGHSVFNRLLGTTTAWVVGVTVVTEVIGSSLLALVLFNERPPAGFVPAAALVLTGVVVVIRSESRSPVVAPVAD